MFLDARIAQGGIMIFSSDLVRREAGAGVVYTDTVQTRYRMRCCIGTKANGGLIVTYGFWFYGMCRNSFPNFHHSG